MPREGTLPAPRAEVVARLNTDRRAGRHTERRGELRVIFASTPLAVRDALHSTLDGLRHLDLTDDEAGTVELVLAEVMNNVVEHAYAGGREGMVELQIAHENTGLRCRIFDDGLPMPGGNLPETFPPDPARPLPAQPEGGFGWFLIRELARDLSYCRRGHRNHISFRLPVGPRLRAS